MPYKRVQAILRRAGQEDRVFHTDVDTDTPLTSLRLKVELLAAVGHSLGETLEPDRFQLTCEGSLNDRVLVLTRFARPITRNLRPERRW